MNALLANAVLTTVVDSCGWWWTGNFSDLPDDHIRRSIVDGYGPGRPPEKREVCSQGEEAGRTVRSAGHLLA